VEEGAGRGEEGSSRRRAMVSPELRSRQGDGQWRGRGQGGHVGREEEGAGRALWLKMTDNISRLLPLSYYY
jgi:hypothetical protein